MSGIVEKSFNNLISGKVFTDFQNIPYEGQKRIITKTALVAAAAGILTGIVAGALPAVVIAGVVGIGAFSYFVTKYQPANFVQDIFHAGVKKITNQNDAIDDIIDGTVELYNAAQKKVADLINNTQKKPAKKKVQFVDSTVGAAASHAKTLRAKYKLPVRTH